MEGKLIFGIKNVNLLVIYIGTMRILRRVASYIIYAQGHKHSANCVLMGPSMTKGTLLVQTGKGLIAQKTG